MMTTRVILLVLLLNFAIPHLTVADPLCPGDATCAERGDAPEGGIAYPDLGISGMFPTCLGGPVGAIVHYNLSQEVWFGNTVDFETDGNDADCSWGQYELDEAWGPFDNDAGLVNTTPYTIFQNQVQPFASLAPDPFGEPCTVVQWGPDIDIQVNNQSGIPARINVLIDWDQSGDWGGESICPGLGPTREHVIWNLDVPVNYSGLLSGLGPGDFLVGPNVGYVWVRFTITNIPPQPIPYDWNGGGSYDLGETEDYLLEIGFDQPSDGAELGDAPEEALAYPFGTMGRFPTCTGTSPAGHISHDASNQVYFGQSIDFELEGNHDLCGFSTHDNDECTSADGDAGLIRPGAFTIKPSGVVQSCPGGNNDPLGDPCQTVAWGPDIDIDIVNNAGDRYLNVVADWSGNGAWADLAVCDNSVLGTEFVLQNFVIPSGFNGALSQLTPPNFVILTNNPWVWFRFSLCDTQVGPSWDGSGEFGDGETEDYLLTVGTLSDVPGDLDTVHQLLVEAAYPNPFNPSVRVAYVMPRREHVTVTIHDAAGALITTLISGEQAAGRHELVWRGADDHGQRQGSGVYLVRFVTATESKSQKVLMLK